MKAAQTPMTVVGLASMIGTIIEWYDFFIYGTAAALVFNKLIFPSSDPLTGTLTAFATFGIGFLIRPLGGVFFGNLGDRFGRRPVLVFTLILMGTATALIGLLPTYQSVGVWAGIILLVLRLLQGLGAGAEYAGAILLAAEYSPTQRGFWASLPAAAVLIAVCLSLVVFLPFAALPQDQFLAWGWRIPFLLSIIVVGLGLYIRMRIMETPEFTHEVLELHREARVPLAELFREYPRTIIAATGANLMFNVGYLFEVFALSYVTRNLHLAPSVGLIGEGIAALLGGVACVVSGTLSDRTGRRANMLVGAAWSTLYALPFMLLLDTRSPFLIAIAFILGEVGLRIAYGVQPSFYVDMFEPRVRYTAIAFAREVSGLVGGATPFIATALVAASGGKSWPVAAFSAALCAINFIAVYLAPYAQRADAAQNAARAASEARAVSA